MADTHSTTSIFEQVLDDLAHSQILAAEAGELALKLYHEASDSAEIGGKLLGLAALSEKSVGLNAMAHEMLQGLKRNLEVEQLASEAIQEKHSKLEGAMS